MRIRHELTHHLSRFYVRTQPDWLAEGLATFFETLVHDRSSGEVLIGLPQPAHLNLLAQQGNLNVAGTLSGALKNQDQPAFYATSWLVVHYFISREREAFARYMRALDGGTEPQQAFRRSLPRPVAGAAAGRAAGLRAHGPRPGGQPPLPAARLHHRGAGRCPTPRCTPCARCCTCGR